MKSSDWFWFTGLIIAGPFWGTEKERLWFGLSAVLVGIIDKLLEHYAGKAKP